MKKTLAVFLFITYTLTADAQWRIGITGGATYNEYSIDKHYMSDWRYKDAWGGTLGLMGQYDFCEWFGVRADLNWTSKNHRQYRTMVPTDYKTLNNYIQLPLMASFSFGSKQLRGFLNTGFYGGYWISSYDDGTIYYQFTTVIYDTVKNDFVKERDQRVDFGLVGGVGIEWRFNLFNRNWAWQIIEARVYYSTTSTQKDYMRINDPKYNTTLAFQSGLCYFF